MNSIIIMVVEFTLSQAKRTITVPDGVPCVFHSFSSVEILSGTFRNKI